MKLLLSLSLLGALIAVAPSAHADDTGGLPSWAAPSSPAPAAPMAPSAAAVPAPPPAPDPVPIDGGLGLLALAGAGYAAKKLREKA